MSLSPPINAQKPVPGIKDYTLIDARGGRIPCLDESAWFPGGFFSNDGRSIPFKCMADRTITKTAEGGVPHPML